MKGSYMDNTFKKAFLDLLVIKCRLKELENILNYYTDEN